MKDLKHFDPRVLSIYQYYVRNLEGKGKDQNHSKFSWSGKTIFTLPYCPRSGSPTIQDVSFVIVCIY